MYVDFISPRRLSVFGALRQPGTTPQAAGARSAPGHRQDCSSLADAINTGPPIDTNHSVRNVDVNETSVTVKPTGNRNALTKVRLPIP